VNDFGFTARDPLPGDGDSYPPPGAATGVPTAVESSAADSARRRQRVLGLPGHTVATLVTGGGWLLLWPAISLWRRGARPLAASWTVTMALVLVATTVVIGRIPDTSTIVETTAFAEDHTEAPTGLLPSNESGTTALAPADTTASGATGPATGAEPAGRSTPRDGRLALQPAPSATAEVPGSTMPTAPETAAPTTTIPAAPSASVTSSATPTSTASTSASTSTTSGPTAYPDCTALNADHPSGVGLPGAVDNTSAGTSNSGFRVSEELYNANSSMDGDADGIACE